MKKLLATLLLVLTATMVYGQGATPGMIQWGNNYAANSFRSLIYGPDPADIGLAQVGQSTSTLEIPSGTTLYNGPLLGSGYTFAFFAGPAGSPSNALTLCAQTTFRTGVALGLVSGGTVSIPGTFGGDQATFQIRVWNNQGGTLNTWAQAEAAWIAGLTDAATSPLVVSGPLAGYDTNLNAYLPQVDSGWVSFNTHGVPEPAIITLGALGAAGLLILRRNRKVN